MTYCEKELHSRSCDHLGLEYFGFVRVLSLCQDRFPPVYVGLHREVPKGMRKGCGWNIISSRHWFY